MLRRKTLLSHLILLFCLLFCFSRPSFAKEIEATHEWTLLGENDTVAAGMHIRMDLSTGEKWVKLPDDDDGTASNSVVIHPDGSSSSSSEVPVHDDIDPDDDFDFDMMHRTLSRLPREEQERMQLPALISKQDPQRVEFESKMRHIWTQRQQELRELELADLPQILKDRIQQMQDYLQGSKLDIIHVLQDLEYHLADIDMTRDFHTLGGWPLLVNLVANSNATEVQMHAAWAVGTAVKNHVEFASFAIESVQLVGRTTKTTVLDVLLQELRQQVETTTEHDLLYKFLYALGSLLRGNRMAQSHFCAAGGAQVLGDILVTAVHQNAVKTAKRLLTLAHDVVMDIKLHEGTSKQVDAAIVSAFSTEPWCRATLQALQLSVLEEEALHATQALTACRFPREALLALQQKWIVNKVDDPDIQKERMHLLETVLEAL
jgi:nucleotide exchange factor SIL1